MPGPNLTPEQYRTASILYDVWRQRRLPYPLLLSAISTGLVEANLTNPHGGDGSSVGWRQETASSYPNVNRMDVRGAANRFYSEAQQNLRSHPNPYTLAQSVQRSAYPGRYAEHATQARQIAHWFLTHHGVPGAAAGGAPGRRVSFDTGPVSATATVTPRPAPEPGTLGGSADLIASILSRRQQAGVPMSIPAPPSFSAQAHGVGGFSPPPIGPLGAPQRDTSGDMLASILKGLSERGQGLAPMPQTATSRLPGVKGSIDFPGGGAPGGAVGGGFKAKAHYAANRRWSPAQVINNIVLPVAHANGVNSGPAGGLSPGEVVAANHQHGPTVSGGRSDHQGPPGTAWAADMSGSKDAMNRLARSLASIFGIPWSGAGLVTKQFGPYRLQLIHNTMAGGNHYTHVHFGIRR